MDTTLTQKFPFILDRNLAKANGTENRVCTSCETVVLETEKYLYLKIIIVGTLSVNKEDSISVQGPQLDSKQHVRIYSSRPCKIYV